MPIINFITVLMVFLSNNHSSNNQDFVLIEQYEDSYQNGVQHGTILKEAIVQQINSWKDHMFSANNLSIEEMEEIIFEKTALMKTIEKVPDLLEELYGIADGANLNRNLVLCYNLGEEIYNYINIPTERCSNLAVSKPDGNILFYNQDLPPFLHGDNKVVILKHPNVFVFTMPGMIALSGISKTLAISCNSLPMLKMNTEGLPLSFAIRALLRKESWEAATDYLYQTPLAIPQNLMMVSKEKIGSFEVSQNSIEACQNQQKSYLLHTNFPLFNKDYKYKNYQSPNCTRYASIDSLTQTTYNTTSYLHAFSQAPLCNQESYLRFLVEYPKPQKLPVIYFINPKQSNTPILLQF